MYWKIGLDDKALTLDLQLKTEQFRMDQSKGMRGLWTQSPQVSISSIDLGFLRTRTTNLLTPDKETIDFNEGIGLKGPRILSCSVMF